VLGVIGVITTVLEVELLDSGLDSILNNGVKGVGH